MTQDEAQAIHARLEKIEVKLEKVVQAIAVYASQREACMELQASLKRAVWGNGRDSLDTRITKLEILSGLRGKSFWAMVAFISAAIAGLVGVAASALIRLL